MCNCMNEMVYKLKTMNEKIDYDYIFPPIEMFSGRAYITFIAKKKGKKKEDKVPVLLSKCPLCGKKYEDKDDKC